jgi:hypothetical protein
MLPYFRHREPTRCGTGLKTLLVLFLVIPIDIPGITNLSLADMLFHPTPLLGAQP